MFSPFRFQVNRRHVTDRRTDERGATYIVPIQVCVFDNTPVLRVDRYLLRTSHYSFFHSLLRRSSATQPILVTKGNVQHPRWLDENEMSIGQQGPQLFWIRFC